MTAITLVEAVTQALAYELAHDDKVVIFGQDIGTNGGVFRATQGLQAKFGEERVRDTPLAENMIAGLAVGMAIGGMKPVAEIQFMDFICASIDQILSHGSRIRNRTRGRLTCPMVIRTPSGGGIRAPEHHSDSMEALFSQIPGLRVVIPSSPARAYGLLLAAIRDPDPVIFMEPKRIYRMVKEEVPDDGEALPLDVCFVLREGKDITLVSWGAMVHETLQVAQKLSQQGIEAEVIDVATVKPLDMDTILQSVEKTGRCVVIQEANPTCSLSSEIIAQLAEKGLTSLMAPPQRVTGYDTVMPLYRLEKLFIPSEQRIMNAVKNVLEYV
ncbi:transketolase C-terminal domain-containing protein [Candidatus Berkiella aquae]|uniref:2-oxoisovalerate dehydrogenase subunit beta n=1 Tax=Candidatus Berkiella aquae TaxID=295108 RepID=A0A0Q9YXY5_9GAMM|nr:alpha-ketoacid dehydrogenase subunit beta [Candidatus Berkiella aquae]MCS5712389.1 alpha-ketoacid dehydrogenase subunit beta [Candidatus Berkiella aquae]